ncbi:MAG TPA: hypothetical protein VKM56_02845, partial [Verrucomicrobiae bacterium]|nr:hypothetical protein [Verrucomicrobiae bacterium]
AATITSSSQPNMAVRWSLSGPACPNSCGTIDASGGYTAPQVLPAASIVTITAHSAADQSKQASMDLTITSQFTLQLTAPETVLTSANAVVVATMIPIAGSNPSTIIYWSLVGTGCTGTACGILSSVTAQNTTSNSISGRDIESANYTAPGNAPTPNTVIIMASPQADPTKKAQATIIVQARSGLVLSPAAATVAANRRVTLSTQLNGTTNSAVNWSVNSIAGGNAAVGKICVLNSNPCSTVLSSDASQVDYLAPGALPLPNPVSVQATSIGDATKMAIAQITVINHDLVSVLPGNVTLPPGAVQKFSASVLGSANQSVVWQLQGSGCAIANACGTIISDGTYTAPGIPPVPNALNVIAISSDDTAQSGSATVSISNSVNIQFLHPASIYAGAATGFTLRVDGGGFRATAPGPGSTLLVGGNPRTTNCVSTAQCTAPVFASDVASTGQISIQLQNFDGKPIKHRVTRGACSKYWRCRDHSDRRGAGCDR